jgi:hypothetical protein
MRALASRALAVVEQNLDGRALAITEHEGTAGHGVLCELFAADGRQAVDAFAEVHWLRGDQDAHRGAGLDHDTSSLASSVGRTVGN